MNQICDNKNDFEPENFDLSEFSWAKEKAKIHIKITDMHPIT
jgi:hypothetical protein